MIVEFCITLPIGLLCIVLGLVVWLRQKIDLIHAYHCRRVKPEDVRAYTRLWGIALVILGVCICAVGVVNWLLATEIGWSFMAVGFLVGGLLGNHAQKKYNGSWFS